MIDGGAMRVVRHSLELQHLLLPKLPDGIGGAMTARPGGIEVVRDPGQTTCVQTSRPPRTAIAS